MRPHNEPSVRWLYARLSRHIYHSARILHQSGGNANSQFRQDLFERRLTESKQHLVMYLNHLSTENFISSRMFTILYNHGMDLIRNYRSQDYDYVYGAVEGYFDIDDDSS